MESANIDRIRSLLCVTTCLSEERECYGSADSCCLEDCCSRSKQEVNWKTMQVAWFHLSNFRFVLHDEDFCGLLHLSDWFKILRSLTYQLGYYIQYCKVVTIWLSWRQYGNASFTPIESAWTNWERWGRPWRWASARAKRSTMETRCTDTSGSWSPIPLGIVFGV